MTPLEQARDRALRTNLEAIVTFRAGLGLTSATPLQRAICRIADGTPLGDLATHPDVLEAVGRVDLLWPGQPDELIVLAPSRTGKSTIAAGMALRATQTVDLSLAKTDGLPPCYAVISLDKEKAGSVYGVVKNALEGPYQHLCVRDPVQDRDGGGHALVRHPSGRAVEIRVTATKAQGAAVISRWLIGLTIDEAARMQGSGAVINLPDTLTAARDRVLPGAQIAMISSKWAPFGPVYEKCEEHGGRPCREKSTVVIGAQGCEAPKLNPSYYTAARMKDIKTKDPSAGLVADNKWQAPAENPFDLELLKRMARPAVECSCDARQRAGLPSAKGEPACPHNDSPPHPRQHYLAVIDPASKGNAWALLLLTIRELWGTPGAARQGGAEAVKGDPARDLRPDAAGAATPLGYRDSIALARQWQGSPAAPLDSDGMWADIADLLRPYGTNRCISDEWAAEEHRALALRHGVYLAPYPTTRQGKVDSLKGIEVALNANAQNHYDCRSLELHPCTALIGDLSRTERRVTQAGVSVHYPSTPDGRHCDFAACLVHGHPHVLQRPDDAARDETPDDREERLEQEALRRLAEQQEQAQQGDDWGGCEHEGVSYDDEW
jgi:hypothetical protein